MARRKKGDATFERAYDLYQKGKIPEAIPVFEETLARKGLDLESELTARFWFACSLHTHGDPERAIEVLEVRSRDRLAMASYPSLANQILTRLLLLEVDTGKPRAQIEETLEQAIRADRRMGRRFGSRLLHARGKFVEACGRRAAGRKMLAKSLERRPNCNERFAVTAHMKVLMPCLLASRDFAAADAAFEAWKDASESDLTKSPHFEFMQADLCRARGELAEAHRWALLARSWAQELDDGLGEIGAAIAWCRVSSLVADAKQSRHAQRELNALRVRGGVLDHFRVAMACLDAGLARASRALGRPAEDLEFECSHAVHANATVDVAQARAELRAGRHALRRCEALAEQLDTAFETAAYRRQLVRRRKAIRELARQSGRGPVAVAVEPLREVVPECPGVDPVFQEGDEMQWILVPPSDLRALARRLTRATRARVVVRGDGVPGSVLVDLWKRGHRVHTLRGFIGPGSAEVRSIALRSEGEADAAAFTRLFDSVKNHFGLGLLEEGKTALEVGEPERAEGVLQRAATYLPERGEVWERYAVSQLTLDRLDPALDACTRALYLDSGKPDAWLTLSRVFRRRGEDEDATASYAQYRARCDDPEET